MSPGQLTYPAAATPPSISCRARQTQIFANEADLQIFNDVVMMGVLASSDLVCRLDELVDVLQGPRVLSLHRASLGWTHKEAYQA